MGFSVKRLAARRSARSEFAFKQDMVKAREDAKFSQAELARRIGVHRSTVSRMERLDSDPCLSELREYLAQCQAAIDLKVIGTCDLVAEDMRHVHGDTVAKVRAARKIRSTAQWDEVEDDVSRLVVQRTFSSAVGS